MASGGRRSAGDRVLESKHVIGLFLLMLLFSGVFFTLGYVMGRNQYDMQVRAATKDEGKLEGGYTPHTESGKNKIAEESTSGWDNPTKPSEGPWGPDYSKGASSDPHLDPAPASKTIAPVAKRFPLKSKPQPQPVIPHTPEKNAKSSSVAPPIPSGSVVIQVAALMKKDDAVAVANGLQKKHYAVFVQSPQKDKYYRVQVGPFKDQKSAEAAKKGLEGEGFKAFYVKH
jgi:septal ring-binding cell division protein DamX